MPTPHAYVPPRMLLWVLLSFTLMLAALGAHEASPGSVVAVSFYKAHLLALGGWGGYWLDRALFPYDRPHQHLQDPGFTEEPDPAPDGSVAGTLAIAGHDTFGTAMLRRAIVVAACLICVGLGA